MRGFWRESGLYFSSQCVNEPPKGPGSFIKHLFGFYYPPYIRTDVLILTKYVFCKDLSIRIYRYIFTDKNIYTYSIVYINTKIHIYIAIKIHESLCCCSIEYFQGILCNYTLFSCTFPFVIMHKIRADFLCIFTYVLLQNMLAFCHHYAIIDLRKVYHFSPLWGAMVSDCGAIGTAQGLWCNL